MSTKIANSDNKQELTTTTSQTFVVSSSLLISHRLLYATNGMELTNQRRLTNHGLTNLVIKGSTLPLSRGRIIFVFQGPSIGRSCNLLLGTVFATALWAETMEHNEVGKSLSTLERSTWLNVLAGTSSKAKHHARILSLDGGGVRSLSSILILREIMEEIGRQIQADRTPLPCEYFDLIGGTCTGGLIAIMLGRLRMVWFYTFLSMKNYLRTVG